MSARRRVRKRAVLAGLALALPACLSVDRPAAEKRRFLLAVARSEPRPAAAQGHLLVAAFRVQSPWAGPGFVYRRAGGEVAVDFLHEFFVPPGTMLADVTRRWLAEAGLFAAVASEGTRLPLTHVLEADVLELAVDEPATGTPTAVVEIEFVLLDSERRLVCRVRSKHGTPLAGLAPDVIVAGWSASVAAVLAELESALRRPAQ